MNPRLNVAVDELLDAYLSMTSMDILHEKAKDSSHVHLFIDSFKSRFTKPALAEALPESDNTKGSSQFSSFQK